MFKEVMFVGKKTFTSKEKGKTYHVVTAGFAGEVVDFFVSKDTYESILLSDYTPSVMEFDVHVYNRNPQLKVLGVKAA